MKRWLFVLIAVALVGGVTVTTNPAQAPGVVFEMETKLSPTDATPEVVEIAVAGQNARMTQAGQGRVIFRGDVPEMVIVNPEDKSYIVMDEATVAAIADRMNQAMAQMEQMMSQMPESQRGMLAEMMKGRGMAMPQAPAEVRRTGEQATHNGFSSTRYEVVRDGRVEQEMWVAPWSAVDGADTVQPVFERMAEFFQVMTDSLAQGGGQTDSDTFGYLDEIDGFPVMTQVFDASGNPTVQSTLRTIDRRTLPSSTFEPPDGYTRQTLPMP